MPKPTTLRVLPTQAPLTSRAVREAYDDLTLEIWKAETLQAYLAQQIEAMSDDVPNTAALGLIAADIVNRYGLIREKAEALCEATDEGSA